MEWFIRIKGEDVILNELSMIFDDKRIADIRKTDDGYFLLADSFDQLSDDSLVYEEANKKIKLINGAIIKELKSNNKINTDGLLIRQCGNVQHAYMHLSENVNLIDCVHDNITINGNNVIYEGKKRMNKLISLASSDFHVAKVLRLLDNELDWRNLYVICEVVLENVNKDKLNSWGVKRELELFKHTANSVCATGDECRHGRETTSPPKLPMDIYQAKQFIFNIIDYWIKEK